MSNQQLSHVNLRTINLRGTQHSYSELRSLVPRQTAEFVGSAQHTVNEIISTVRERGAEYLRELSTRFDGVEQGGIACSSAGYR